jgi:hypothetical protein
MWLEAVLSKEDLLKVATDFTPLTIGLGEEGELLLKTPSEVTLVADRGLRITCEAQIHWPILGVNVPLTLNALTVIVRPAVDKREGGSALVFFLELEHADLAIVPSILDHRMTELVNKELAAKHVELAWNFSETLSHTFALPAVLKNASSLGIEVAWGAIRITADALVFAVSLHSVIQHDRTRVPAELADSTASEEPKTEPRMPPLQEKRMIIPPRQVVAFGAIMALAVGCGSAIGYALTRRGRPNRRVGSA